MPTQDDYSILFNNSFIIDDLAATTYTGFLVLFGNLESQTRISCSSFVMSEYAYNATEGFYMPKTGLAFRIFFNKYYNWSSSGIFEIDSPFK